MITEIDHEEEEKWNRIEQLMNSLPTIEVPRSLVVQIGVKAAVAVSAVHQNFDPTQCGVTPFEFQSVVQKGHLIRVRKYTDEEIKDILCAKRAKLYGPSLEWNYATEVCTWCGIPSRRLNQHHFPVRKRDNGEDTVLICANCHMEFHDLEHEFTYVVSDECMETIREWELSQ